MMTIVSWSIFVVDTGYQNLTNLGKQPHRANHRHQANNRCSSDGIYKRVSPAIAPSRSPLSSHHNLAIMLLKSQSLLLLPCPVISAVIAPTASNCDASALPTPSVFGASAVEFDDNNERVLGPLPIEKETLVIIFQSSHDAHAFGRKYGDVQAELGTNAVALSPAATIDRNSRESRRSNVLLRP